MAKKKVKKVKGAAKSPYYKGYDINWLRDVPEHPDFHLVAEYEAKKK